MEDFVEKLKDLLVCEENGYTKEEAERLIKTHTNVIVNGIMGNNLRATVMALQMEESKIKNHRP